MLATPLTGLKVFARDAVFRGLHLVDLHTLTHLYLFVIFMALSRRKAFHASAVATIYNKSQKLPESTVEMDTWARMFTQNSSNVVMLRKA